VRLPHGVWRSLLAALALQLTLASASVAVPLKKGPSAAVQVSSGTTAAAKFATKPAAGTTVLAFIQTAGQISSVVDNGRTPQAFTLDASTTGGTGAYIFRANNVTRPASGAYRITVTLRTKSTIQVKAIAFAGLAAGRPQVTNKGSGTGTAVRSNAVTSAGRAVFFGGFSDNSRQNPQRVRFTSAPAGFAEQWRNTNGARFWPAALAAAIVPRAATKSLSWTLGSSSDWGAAIAVYPAAHPHGDTTPPNTTISSAPPDPSSSGAATFTFAGTDKATRAADLTFQCRLDAAPYADCASPRPYYGLANGSHRFQVRAIDAAGNVDHSPAAKTWTIDGVNDRLPDLGLGPINQVGLDTTTLQGHRLLRFNGTITNAGTGPFELHGTRASTSDPEMTVEQRIYQITGGYRSVATSATMFYAGDGHDHWHVKDLEGAALTDAAGNMVGGGYAKIGYCPSDNAIYDGTVMGTPKHMAYKGCGNKQPDLLDVLDGISVGWGDWYNANVAFQWIDITGVPDGTYRIWLFADPNDNFRESNETNNSTWTDVRIDDGVHIVAYGPAI